MASPLSCLISSLASSIVSAKLESASGSGVFLSPMSIYSAICLTLNAAGLESESHKQLLHFLSTECGRLSALVKSESDINAELGKLCKLLQGSTSESAQDSTVLCSNSIWTKGGSISLKKNYVDNMESSFGATAKEATSAKDVNVWVSEESKGKIPDLLAEDADFDCVLANVLYFKGLWSTAFKPELSRDRSFTLFDGSKKDVMTMVGEFEKEEVIKCPGVYTGVYLPYLGGTYRAQVILPEQTGAQGMKDALAAMADSSVKKDVMHPPKVMLCLPRFKVDTSMELSQLLPAMGVKDIFSGGKADLSRLSDAPGLYVSSVIHKCVVEVDEEGTTAAAATAVMMNRSMPMPPEELVVDRPFIFIIQHAESQMLLFVGAMTNP